MQKVIRATERAKTQARRRNLIKGAKVRSMLQLSLRREANLLSKDKDAAIKAARIARQEDWLLGPLAPRRDLGSLKSTYGTVSQRLVKGVEKLGKIHNYCITEGDRVVIVGDLLERGMIGTVNKVNRRAETCKILGFNMVDVKIPDYMLEEAQKKAPIQTYEAPIPLSAVRLVFPLRNKETGLLRDVIINELKRTSNFEQGLGLDGRYIADSDPRIYIPVPEKEEKEITEHQMDTLRIEVEQSTWTPTLTQPPMPPTLIDELRNKYSKFRDRHDESWVKARERRAAEREKAASMKEERMVTPLEELNRRKKLKKIEVMEKPLNSEILMRIGKLMAKKKRHRSAS